MFSVALHPVVIHFAIALLVVGPLMDTLGLLLRRESLLMAGRWNVLLGAGMLALAELSGLAASADLGEHSAAGQALLNLHSALGHLCVALWLPVALWRALAGPLIPLRARTLHLTLSYIGAALILSETALGETLIYRHGVGLSAAARAEPMLEKPAAPTVIDHPSMGPPKN